LSRDVDELQNSWVCPRCHATLPENAASDETHVLPLDLWGRLVHVSASLPEYTNVCPSCDLPYSADGSARFSYPYRQLLARIDLRGFLRWSAAQTNGYVSYSLMKGSSCSVDGREDVSAFAEFIQSRMHRDPDVLLDLGSGPLPHPFYLPDYPDARRVGIDPFESAWDGSFVEGVGEFIPLASGSVDLCVAATALDHTLDLGRVAGELARVTRAGGSLMVWDHTFPQSYPRFRALFQMALPSVPWSAKVKLFRSNFLPERVRVYDNGIVLWTPRGYADPFHEPRSRRPSWAGRLRRTLERAGFRLIEYQPETGFSYYRR
jgi:SAM-dependent methyltransferase